MYVQIVICVMLVHGVCVHGAVTLMEVLSSVCMMGECSGGGVGVFFFGCGRVVAPSWEHGRVDAVSSVAIGPFAVK